MSNQVFQGQLDPMQANQATLASLVQLESQKEGKSIVVTGGAQGIGFGIAAKLAMQGHHLVLADRNGDLAQSAADYLVQQGYQATWVQGDVTVRADHEKFVETAVQAYGKLDAYFNNAGIDQVNGMENISEAEFDAIFAINVKGPNLGMQAAHQQFLRQRQTNPTAIYKIVNTASIAALMSFPMLGAYCQTKAGVHMMTRQAAQEWAQDGITVNELNPGVVLTPMWHHIAEEMAKEGGYQETADQVFEGFKNIIPLGREQTPADVANAAAFLASEDSDYITGLALVTDGGVMLGGKVARKSGFVNQLVGK